jgi:hypothetical protein
MKAYVRLKFFWGYKEKFILLLGVGDELMRMRSKQPTEFHFADDFILSFIRSKSYERYRGSDKSLARPTSRGILFDDENISFDASLVLYIEWAKSRYTVILYTVYLLLAHLLHK